MSGVRIPPSAQRSTIILIKPESATLHYYCCISYNIFIKKFAIEKESSLKGRKEIFDKPTVKTQTTLIYSFLPDKS